VKAALDLIEQIVEEHKTIRLRLQSMEQIVNDAEALQGFEEAQESLLRHSTPYFWSMKTSETALLTPRTISLNSPVESCLVTTGRQPLMICARI